MLAQKETNRKNVNLFLLKEDETEQNEKAAAAIGVCVCVRVHYFLKNYYFYVLIITMILKQYHENYLGDLFLHIALANSVLKVECNIMKDLRSPTVAVQHWMVGAAE